VEHLDILDDPYYLNELCSVIRQLLADLGVHDFTIKVCSPLTTLSPVPLHSVRHALNYTVATFTQTPRLNQANRMSLMFIYQYDASHSSVSCRRPRPELPIITREFLQDVIAPEPKRTRKHLSVFFNFARFREYKASVRGDMEEEMQRALERNQALVLDVQDAEAEYQQVLQEQAGKQRVRFLCYGKRHGSLCTLHASAALAPLHWLSNFQKHWLGLVYGLPVLSPETANSRVLCVAHT
jgi:hypothetical protein